MYLANKYILAYISKILFAFFIILLLSFNLNCLRKKHFRLQEFRHNILIYLEVSDKKKRKRRQFFLQIHRKVIENSVPIFKC